MALTANRNVQMFVAENEQYEDYPLGAAVHLYQNAFVGLDPAGYIKAFVPGDQFIGIAYDEVDNSSGLAGALYGRVLVGGADFSHALTSVAITDVGKPVYATADNTLALTGHFDAYVGRVVSYVTTDTCRVHLRHRGDRPFPGESAALEAVWDGARMSFGNVATAGGEIFLGAGWRTDSIGAGITGGTSGINAKPTLGETALLLDNDNEAQNLTIESPYSFDVAYGITAEFDLRLLTAGGAATDDLDFGVAALSTTGLTDTERANMDATTAGLLSAKFHLDTNAADVYFSSDDNSAPVAATDTTVDLATVIKKFKIVVRTTGITEVWIAGVRKLTTTVFSVGTSGVFGLFVNLEKSTGTGVPEVRIRRLRIAGAVV